MEALAATCDEVPDLMLVDIGMPRMTGYELARAVRRDPAYADVRLVALTRYGREEDRARVLEAGFDLHLTKPVADTKLRDVLESMRDARSGNDIPNAGAADAAVERSIPTRRRGTESCS